MVAYTYSFAAFLLDASLSATPQSWAAAALAATRELLNGRDRRVRAAAAVHRRRADAGLSLAADRRGALGAIPRAERRRSDGAGQEGRTWHGRAAGAQGGAAAAPGRGALFTHNLERTHTRSRAGRTARQHALPHFHMYCPPDAQPPPTRQVLSSEEPRIVEVGDDAEVRARCHLHT